MNDCIISDSKTNLKPEHIALTSANDVAEICKPLFAISDVNYFDFFREYCDGSRIWLSTNSMWTQYLYQNSYFAVTNFSLDPKNLYISDSKIYGAFLWDSLQTSLINPLEAKLFADKLRDAKENFDIANGIALIEKHPEHTDYFSFGASARDTSVINFYINNLQCLENFIPHFLEQAEKLLQQSSLQKIVQANQKQILSYQELYTSLQPKSYYANQFDTTNTANKLSLEENEYLTQREKMCIYYTIRGKSARETAQILSVSPRTVEFHLSNAKAKLKCKNKSELIGLFID